VIYVIGISITGRSSRCLADRKWVLCCPSDDFPRNHCDFLTDLP